MPTKKKKISSKEKLKKMVRKFRFKTYRPKIPKSKKSKKSKPILKKKTKKINKKISPNEFPIPTKKAKEETCSFFKKKENLPIQEVQRRNRAADAYIG